MKFIKLGIVSLACTLLAACASGPKVFTDYDPEQNFTQYESFAWISDNPMTVKGENIISPLIEERIKNAVKMTMETKGYRFSKDIDAADMLVSFTIGSRDKVRVDQNALLPVGGWRWGWQYWGNVGPIHAERTSVYTQGSLAIDIFDKQRNAPVWHGVSNKRIANTNPETVNALVNDVVSSILSQYPKVNQSLPLAQNE